MTSKVRIEYVLPRRVGSDGPAVAELVLEQLAPAQNLTVGTSSVAANAAPTMPSHGGISGGAFARVTCTMGAVIVAAPAAAPVATETTGVRLDAGAPPILMPINAGEAVACIEAVDITFNSIIEPDGLEDTPITTTRAKWVDDFGGSALDATQWDVYDGGLYPGYAANTVGSPSGSGVTGITYAVSNSTLVVTLGVVPNAELHFLSKQTFTSPMDVTIAWLASQAIVNNNVYFEIVEVAPTTGLPVPHATLASEIRNRAGMLFNGATASTIFLEGTCDDSPNGVNNVTTTSFLSVTSAVDTVLEYRPDDTWLGGVNTDNSSSKTGAALRLSRQVPDPNKLYKVRLRFKNGSTAPASSTAITLYRILVQDVQELLVQVSGGKADTAAGKGVSIVVANTANIQGAGADNSTVTSIQPVMAGVLMTATAGGPTAGTAARVGSAQGDLARRQVIKPLGIPQSHDPNRVALASTSETTLIAAVALIRHEVQSFTIANRDTIQHTFDIRDATAGSIRETVVLGAGQTQRMEYPAGYPQAAVNNNWTVTMLEAVTTTAPVVSSSSYRTNA